MQRFVILSLVLVVSFFGCLTDVNSQSNFKGCVNACQPECGERCAELGSFGMTCAITWPRNQNNYCRCTNVRNGDIPVCGVNGSERLQFGFWLWNAVLLLKVVLYGVFY